MRLVETCACGATIELLWDEVRRYGRSVSDEPKSAAKEIAAWRKAHKPCLAARLAQAPRRAGEENPLDVPPECEQEAGG